MELLNVITARSVWLFDTQDLNPRGETVFPQLLITLKKKYEFAVSPSSIADVDKDTKALIFTAGHFKTGDGRTVDIELSVYNDGLIANSRSSTRDTDAFLEDVLSTAAKEFNLSYSPQMMRAKLHTSEVTVHLAPALSNLNQKLKHFAARLTALCDGSNTPAFEFAGLSFANDSFLSPLKLAPFAIERKLGAPFSEQRFYSKAPLQTHEHLELLHDFEALLLG